MWHSSLICTSGALPDVYCAASSIGSTAVSHAALHAICINVYMESKSNLSNPNRVPAGTRREVLKLSGSFCRYDALGGAVVCILIRGGGYHHQDLHFPQQAMSTSRSPNHLFQFPQNHFSHQQDTVLQWHVGFTQHLPRP